MRSTDEIAGPTPRAAGAAPTRSVAPALASPDVDVGQAAHGPIPAPVSAADNPAPRPAPAPDAPAEALGRRTLSTAFVMVGPNRLLTVELRDGRVLTLRDVVMGDKDYCGIQASGERYCGGYGDVTTARPGSTALDR